MKKTTVTHKVFVQLDALLDTRLAAVAAVDPAWAEQLIATGKYHDRRHHQFSALVSEIDDEQVRERWKSRDMEVLSQAVSTSIVDLISDLCIRYRIGKDLPMGSYSIKLVVNLSPYPISDEGKAYLLEVIQDQCGADEVEACYLPINYIHPGYLGNFDTVILDDFDDWSNHHLLKLKENPMPRTHVYAPNILLDPAVEDKALPEALIGNIARTALADVIKLELMPVYFFSIKTPDTI